MQLYYYNLYHYAPELPAAVYNLTRDVKLYSMYMWSTFCSLFVQTNKQTNKHFSEFLLQLWFIAGVGCITRASAEIKYI